MQKARGRAYVNIASADCKHLVSGSISLPCSGFFSPFPHGTRSLSVIRSYLALPDGPGRFPRNSTCSVVLGTIGPRTYCFRLQGFHLLRLTVPSHSSNSKTTAQEWHLLNPNSHYPHTATRASLHSMSFGLFPFRSPLLRESHSFSFPGPTEMFQFKPFSSLPYRFRQGCSGFA